MIKLKIFKRKYEISRTKWRFDIQERNYFLRMLRYYSLTIVVVNKYNCSSVYKSFDFISKFWIGLRNTFISLLISFLYWIINHLFDNCLIVSNNLISTIFFGLSLVTLINLWSPVGIKENISDESIKKIIRDEIKEIERENKIRNSYK